MLDDMDTHELAWAAGFFDGEGTIGQYFATRHTHPWVKVSIAQVDPAVLYRFQRAVLGLGTVRGPYDRAKWNQRPQYRFDAGSFEQVQAMMALLWRWLSPVKRAQTVQAFRSFHALRAANPAPIRKAYGHHQVHGRPIKRLVHHVKERCIHGHPFTEENTYTRPSDGARVCKTCRREQMARYVRKVG